LLEAADDVSHRVTEIVAGAQMAARMLISRLTV